MGFAYGQRFFKGFLRVFYGFLVPNGFLTFFFSDACVSVNGRPGSKRFISVL